MGDHFLLILGECTACGARIMLPKRFVGEDDEDGMLTIRAGEHAGVLLRCPFHPVESPPVVRITKDTMGPTPDGAPPDGTPQA